MDAPTNANETSASSVAQPVVAAEPVQETRQNLRKNAVKGTKPLRGSFHGIDYQLKITLWRLLVALLHLSEGKYVKCTITAEDPHGGKFDDTVFHYKLTKDSPEKVLYIQAKHKDNENEKYLLTKKELLDIKNKPFFLGVYFKSFCEQYGKGKTDGAIYAVCTNARVFQHVELLKKVESTDDILSNFNSVGACIYQINGDGLYDEQKFIKYLVDEKIIYTADQREKFIEQFFLISDMQDVSIDEDIDQLWAKIVISSRHPQMGLVEGTIAKDHLFFEAWRMTKSSKTKTETDITNLFNAIVRNINYLKFKGTSEIYRYTIFEIKKSVLEISNVYKICKNGGFLEYYTMMDKEVSFSIIHQIARLLGSECITIDEENFLKHKKVIKDIYFKLETPLVLAIAINTDNVKRILQNLSEREDKKVPGFLKSIILVVLCEEQRNDDLYVISDLSDQSKREIFNIYSKVKIFHTDIILKDLLSEEDMLAMLVQLMKAAVANKNVSHPHEESFNKIKAFYINRPWSVASSLAKDRSTSTLRDPSFQKGFGLKFHELETFLHQDEPMFFDELAEQMKLRLPFYDGNIITSSHDHIMEQGFHQIKTVYTPPPGMDSNIKVHIFLEKVGFGKTTYITWLAWYFKVHRPSYWIIRLNAIEYSCDFEQILNNHGTTIDGNRAIRILFQLILLALTMPTLVKRSSEETESERMKMKRWSRCLSLSEGKVVLACAKNAPIEHQIALRVFREKFNKKQIVLLLDGFDEITPNYKHVVLSLFSQFAKFKGIDKLFFTSRPYNFEEELKATFNVALMYRMNPFTSEDQYQFLHNYLGCNISEYCSWPGIQRMFFLEILGEILKELLKEMHFIPLFFKMALDILISLMKKHVDLKNCAIFPRLFHELQSMFGKSRMIKALLDQKLTISSVEKLGLDKNTISTAAMQNMMNLQKKHTENRLLLLGIYTIIPSGYQPLLQHELEECKTFMREIAEGLEKSGIVEGVQGEVPLFIHRMFAEYLAARWLFDNKNRDEVQRLFKSKFYWNPENSVVRMLFDEIAIRSEDGNDSPLHLAIMQNDIIKLEQEIHRTGSNLHKKIDTIGRSSLHMAIQYKYDVQIVDLLVKTMDSIHISDFIDARDNLLGWSALDYVFHIHHSTKVGYLHLLSKNALLNADELTYQYQLLLSDPTTAFTTLAHYERDVMSATHVIDNYKPLCNHCAHRIETMSIICNIVVTYTKLNRRKWFEAGKADLLLMCAETDAACLLRSFLANENKSLFETMLAQIITKASNYRSLHVIRFLIEYRKIDFKAMVRKEDVYNLLYYSIEKKYEEWCTIFLDLYCSKLNISRHKHWSRYGLSMLELLLTLIVCGSLQMVQHFFARVPIVIDVGFMFAFLTNLARLDDRRIDLKVLRYVLNRVENIYECDAEGRTLLHRCAELGYCQWEMLKSLIEYKHFDATTVNSRNGWNAFHYGVSVHKDQMWFPRVTERHCVHCDSLLNIYRYMIQTHANPLQAVNKVDAEGRNVFYLAIINEHFPIAKLILDLVLENFPSEVRPKKYRAYINQSNLSRRVEFAKFLCYLRIGNKLYEPIAIHHKFEEDSTQDRDRD